MMSNLSKTLLIVCVSLSTSSDAEEIVFPKLPKKPFQYADQVPPGYLKNALREADNTPKDNRLTNAGATLGRVLFYDKQLSKNNTVSCASCHSQVHAFTDPRRFSVGFLGGHTRRNAMGLANLRYSVLNRNRPGFFWDERAPTLEAQALMPIQDKIEMGMELPALVEKLQSLPYYPPLFTSAYGSDQVTADRIAKAIAQFVRSMTSFDSQFDQAVATQKVADYSQDFASFTKQENLGKSLFIDGVGRVAEIGCAHCHVPPTFGMPTSFNNGLDMKYKDKGLGGRDLPSNDPLTPNNNGKFKASSLRNIVLTAPYMHDGRFQTLEQVLDHYSSGVHPHENVAIAFSEDDSDEQNTHGFDLTDEQKSAIIAFLKTLTDEKFIKDSKFSDPFVQRKN